MSTALFEVALSIQDRRLEVEVLLDQASASVDGNDRLYKALCRACCVLLASHLEGFLKDLTRSLILDFNYHRESFSDMPDAMKRSFCERIVYFEGVPPREISNRINQLVAFFDKNSVAIELEAFSYKQSSNKNPSVDFIDTMLSKIGVPSAIHSISGSRLELVFDNDRRTNFTMLRDIKRFRSHLFHFPYKPLPPEYHFNKPKSKPTSNTIWHTLIEEIMIRRHSIAHGDTMDNIADHETLRTDIIKLDVLMHGLMYTSAAYLSLK